MLCSHGQGFENFGVSDFEVSVWGSLCAGVGLHGVGLQGTFQSKTPSRKNPEPQTLGQNPIPWTVHLYMLVEATRKQGRLHALDCNIG